MEFQNPISNSLTIPQGATTGSRIVINENNSGTIRVYDNNDNLVAEISGKDLTSGVFEAFTDVGDFATSLLGQGLQFFNSSGGFLNTMGIFQALDTRYIGWNTILQGGVAFDTQTAALLPVTPGSNTVRQWNTVTNYGSGWASGTGIGGSYPPLKWRYTVENDIWVFGLFHATSTTVTQPICSGFPAVNITGPLGGEGVGGACVKVNASSVCMGFYINELGQLRTSSTPTVAVNDTFMINARIPLGALA